MKKNNANIIKQCKNNDLLCGKKIVLPQTDAAGLDNVAVSDCSECLNKQQKQNNVLLK